MPGPSGGGRAALARPGSNGSTGQGDSVTLQVDFTTRYNLPLDVLASVRNRVSFNWGIGRDTAYTFTYRARPQLEREFDLGGTSLIPLANAEFFWQHPPEMWTQFQPLGGIQYGLQAFAEGQAVELNFSVISMKDDWKKTFAFEPQARIRVSPR